MRTGRDLGVFGGLFALFIGFMFISAGPNLIKYGDTVPPSNHEAIVETENEPLDVKIIVLAAVGTMCAAGGVLGFLGSALANRAPKAAGKVMVIGGVLAAFTVIGAVATAALALGGMRALDYANAPPDTEPEWQDVESLSY
jgi:hypothetical protein